MSKIRKLVTAALLAVTLTAAGLFGLQAPVSAAARAPLSAHPYTIRPSINDQWKCLDVQGLSQSNGALLQIYDCLGSQQSNQVFYLWSIDGTSSIYQITPAHSWKCLDVQGYSYNDWAPLQQYDCLGTSQQNQTFGFIWEPSCSCYGIVPTHSWKPVNYYSAQNGASVYQRGAWMYWKLYDA